ncbi:sensor histidine kinase [Planktothrix paucivesiculata]|uniref:histidine kinase n=1 Tax=Planktothrix paucivesiculata PCC 9631 TaxID=671071 RepID=A0A7Z9BXD4_9CYAN|nr:HAMP domain-containing sensor histidine kinase [Planktothrix paucivesiculata]VXD21113.1 Histidine Kinase [Planktothrix paucivesiculata PCC 9631]
MLTASAEFVQLCRTQLSLTASLGASLSVVYLAEAWVDEEHKKLIPIASYPETSLDNLDIRGLMGLPETFIPSLPPRLRIERAGQRKILRPAVEIDDCSETPGSTEDPRQQRSQKVLALIQEDVVLGFLVTGRNDRPWNAEEYVQLQAIAHTLTLGCILDQRAQWFEQQLDRQQHLQGQQADALHNIFHQLKSPLTAVRTFGKLLLKRLLPEDKNYPIAKGILRESDRIQELLEQADQTLEYTETSLSLPLTLEVATPRTQTCLFSAPILPLLPACDQLEPLFLSEILLPLIISAQAIAQERKLGCEVDLPENLPPIQGNAKALREVLSNLLDNALKYTPPGGKLYIRVQLAPPSLESKNLNPQVGIGISDTGPGIPPEDLEHLFERHYRGVQGNSEIPGTGLGLAIAKALIQQMQGEIQVFSPANPAWTSPDRDKPNGRFPGTTFILWVQVAIPDQELNLI